MVVDVQRKLVEVGHLFEGQKVFDVVVWGAPEVRNSISNVRDLLVDTPNGGQVRIGEVADIREKPNPAVIRREKVSLYMDVNFTVPKGQISALAGDIESSLAQLDFPLEYHAELIGDFKSLREARGTLAGIIIAALIGIFLLLQAAFWSWRLTALVLPSLLFALSGGLLIALFTGGALTMGVLAGLLAVFGVAVYQGVLLIRHFKQLEMEGEPFGPGLVIDGVQDRIGAILMTTILTALAFLPFAFFGNAPGMSMLAPMSYVVLGGLVTTLITTLFILPALFLTSGKVSEEIMEDERSIIDLDVLTPA